MVSLWLVVCVCLLCVYVCVCVCWATPSTSSSSARANTWLSSFRICLAICRSKFSWLPWHWHWHFACSPPLPFSLCVLCVVIFLCFPFSTIDPTPPPLSHSSVSPHDSDFWHFTRVNFVPSFFISLACFFLSFSRLGGKGQHSFCIDKPSTYLPGEMGSRSCSPVADSA